MKLMHIPLFERSALPAWLAVAVIATSFAAQAATITVNSVADDVFINAAGLTFSDAAYTVPVAPAYCTETCNAVGHDQLGDRQLLRRGHDRLFGIQPFRSRPLLKPFQRRERTRCIAHLAEKTRDECW